MKCPCPKKAKLDVIDSRIASNGTSVKRRRQCQECKQRFLTEETVFARIKSEDINKPKTQVAPTVEKKIKVVKPKTPIRTREPERRSSGFDLQETWSGRRSYDDDIRDSGIDVYRDDY